LSARPNEALIGDLALRGVKSDKIIGSRIFINGESYIFSGVIEYYKGVYVYSNNEKQILYALLHFHYENAADKYETEDALLRALGGYFKNITLLSNNDEYFYQNARGETNAYIAISIAGCIFCLACIFNVIYAILYDNIRTIKIKTATGASFIQLLFEMFLYFLFISVLSSACSVLLMKLTIPFLINLGLVPVPLFISYKTVFILAALSLLTSFAASFYTMLRLTKGKLA